MTTQKFKVLGVEQGITITRPFNNEMYAHNEKVRQIQNDAILKVLEEIEDEDLIRKAAKVCSGYGYGSGYDANDMLEDAIRNVETSANSWMREDIWPGFIKLGLVQPIDIDYVGYKK